MSRWLTYSELIRFPTYEERLHYLQKNGKVGEFTFGGDRWINQEFYKSKEWKDIRQIVIIRDNGCDLAIDGMYLDSRNIIIHHLNEITERDILERTPRLFDLNNLVVTSRRTHNAIHYKTDQVPDPYQFTERTENDLFPWKKHSLGG